MITSTSNQQMKNLSLLMKKAKARNEQGIFIVEGRKMAEEIPADWLEKTYVSESFLKENELFLQDFEYEVVSDSVFKSVSDTQTPQGILCLVKKPEYELEQLLKGETIKELIDEQIVFNQLDRSPTAIWSLLLASGYLKLVSFDKDTTIGGRRNCELAITNQETMDMFYDMVLSWFTE